MREIIGGKMRKEGLEKKQERQILVFRLTNGELGLDISCVREILRPQEIYPLPKTPPFVEGVINLRGHIVPLIDLGWKLSGKQTEGESNKRIIICRVNKFIIGLTVSSLKEIITLSEEDIKPTPAAVSLQIETEVLSGIARVGERIIPILDLEYILTKKEVSELSTLKQP